MEIQNSILVQQNNEVGTPQISLKLFMPDGRWSPELSCVFDTGYGGDIILQSNLFEIWSSAMERVPSDAEIAETATGEVVNLRSVDSRLKLGPEEFPVIISSHSSIDENIMGWGVIRRFLSLISAEELIILSH